MALALSWLCTGLVTLGALALSAGGLLPGGVPWPLVALCAFLAFALLSYLKITGLESRLGRRPALRVDAHDGPWNNRIIEMSPPVFAKLLTIEPTSYVRNCVVKLNDLRRLDGPCQGFVPTPLSWLGPDGPGAGCKSFAGREFVILLSRHPASPTWEIPTPGPEFSGGQAVYEPGAYQVEIVASAENVARHKVVRGILRVGVEHEDVQFFRRGE